MIRYRRMKVPKDTERQMSSLQRTLWEKAGRHSRGATMADLIYVGRPYRNKYGEKMFASIDKIRGDVAILVEHKALEKRA